MIPLHAEANPAEQTEQLTDNDTILTIAPEVLKKTAPHQAAPVDQHSQTIEQLIEEGMNHIGVRYRYGGASAESGFDCSGLVLNVFRSAIGIDMPRTARGMARLGEKISRPNLQPGDLVFFNTMRRTFSHVGIYIGENRFLHAPSRGGRVRIDTLSGYWKKNFNGARRIINEELLSNLIK